MNNIGIVIPTYNARITIAETIKKIQQNLNHAVIVVVDDNSPDQTAEFIKKKYNNNIKLILREKRGGRGSAVIAGLNELYKNKSITSFIEMDADLCHNPKYLKQLVDKNRRTDVIIASRYQIGSRIINWSLKRKMMSYAMNLLCKIFLGIPITDYTNGFRCYSRNAVKKILAHTFVSHGFVVLSETAYVCYKGGLSFDEVPISFSSNSTTKSNLTLKEIGEALHTIFLLRLSQYL